MLHATEWLQWPHTSEAANKPQALLERSCPLPFRCACSHHPYELVAVRCTLEQVLTAYQNV